MGKHFGGERSGQTAMETVQRALLQAAQAGRGGPADHSEEVPNEGSAVALLERCHDAVLVGHRLETLPGATGDGRARRPFQVATNLGLHRRRKRWEVRCLWTEIPILQPRVRVRFGPRRLKHCLDSCKAADMWAYVLLMGSTANAPHMPYDEDRFMLQVTHTMENYFENATGPSDPWFQELPPKLIEDDPSRFDGVEDIDHFGREYAQSHPRWSKKGVRVGLSRLGAIYFKLKELDPAWSISEMGTMMALASSGTWNEAAMTKMDGTQIKVPWQLMATQEVATWMLRTRRPSKRSGGNARTR